LLTVSNIVRELS